MGDMESTFVLFCRHHSWNWILHTIRAHKLVIPEIRKTKEMLDSASSRTKCKYLGTSNTRPQWFMVLGEIIEK